jgi:triacylglycerol esterase/lipase EstA (alpha/beta hydrolase family)
MVPKAVTKMDERILIFGGSRDVSDAKFIDSTRTEVIDPFSANNKCDDYTKYPIDKVGHSFGGLLHRYLKKKNSDNCP